MNIQKIQEILLDIVQKLFPHSIWNESYVESLWNKYANISGFLVGFLLLAILYFASDHNKKWYEKGGVLNIFALVALINSVTSLYQIIYNFILHYLFKVHTTSITTNIGTTFNPIAIFILSLVIVECYKYNSKKAMFFGISTFGATILMFGSGYTEGIVLFAVFIRVVIAGLLCAGICKLKYLYAAYAVMSIYYVISDGIIYFLNNIYKGYGVEYFKKASFWTKEVPDILLQYKADYCIIAVILCVWIVFERIVLTEPVKAKTA